MAVNVYTGTPGSGKSTHLARDCFDFLRFGKNVISNTPLNMKMIENYNKSFWNILKPKIKTQNYFFVDSMNLSVNKLINFARNKHKTRQENQTLLVIDECQVFFNCREFTKGDRANWIDFLLQHRKLGYTIIMVTPNMRIVDKQIRGVFENEVKHRLVNNSSIGFLMPVKTFVAVTYWVGVRVKMQTEFFTGNKFLYNFFDSYALLGSLSNIRETETTRAVAF